MSAQSWGQRPSGAPNGYVAGLGVMVFGSGLDLFSRGLSNLVVSVGAVVVAVTAINLFRGSTTEGEKE